MDWPKKEIHPRTNLLKDVWIWKIALADARNHQGRLLLYIASLTLGITVFVAINAFNYNLEKDIENQSKALLGADVVLYSDQPFNKVDSLFFDSLEMVQAKDARLNTMVAFPNIADGQLVQLVAIGGPYPLHGQLLTEPETAIDLFREGEVALLDYNLALKYDIAPGNQVKIGDLILPVAGVVNKIPGNVQITNSMAPSVYIPFHLLNKTALIKKGSRVSYRKFFKNPPGFTAEETLRELRGVINENGFSYETVDYRRENLGKGFQYLYQFLNLLGFIALFLGSIGVASSVYIYLKEKTKVIGMIRFLGATKQAAFWVFFLQALLVGIFSSLFGVVMGNLLQAILPMLLDDFIPIQLSYAISWDASLSGLLLGIVLSTIFALLPLMSLRQTTAISILKAQTEDSHPHWKGKYRLLLFLLLFSWSFAIYQSGDFELGSTFFAGLVFTFLVLLLMGELVMQLARWMITDRFGFAFRQGMSNLYRPNNQTRILVAVIGLGVFLVSTMTLVQDMVLKQAELVGLHSRANLVLFDVQPEQKEEIITASLQAGMEVNQVIPIVTSRLSGMRGKTLSQLAEDQLSPVPNWLLYTEHILTYRDHLLPEEKLLEGQFQAEATPGKDTVKVSITSAIAQRMRLGIGDEVVFNVQGMQFRTQVGSIRQTNWQEVQSNFLFVFPKGILEKVPQYYALLNYSPSKEVTAQFQRAVTATYPGISVVDLALVLKTLDDVLGKITFVIRFMAFFSIATGLLVLAGAVSNSRYARLKENVLLRTLGASRRQVGLTTLMEYTYLGFFAGFTGAVLSVAASWLLASYFFGFDFAINIIALVGILFLLVGLTITVGWLNSRGLLDQPPLAILRKEVK